MNQEQNEIQAQRARVATMNSIRNFMGRLPLAEVEWILDNFEEFTREAKRQATIYYEIQA